ncbi:MAG: tRNA (adenosine(37)-N6)-dimethylallyltransferase MiaA [Chloroflexota bacterium]|nr:MAG: tRNA (adenosine(37)-N6)-dimethylallyltransferase MiaA [Chloroflexota bacterium]
MPTLSDAPAPTCAVAIVGPTAVGKSRLALDLAAMFEVDIISADSRQVYRYMDIGTDKPTASDRARVPHYMLDLVAPDDTYSVRRYQLEARRVLRRSVFRKRVSLVVGGTGFYVQALLDDVALPAVAPNRELRERLTLEAEKCGAAALHERLRTLDPRSAHRVHTNNIPRIIRALEVIDALGAPVPELEIRSAVPALYLGVHMNRSSLYEIADRRVKEQFDGGLVEETEYLLRMGYDASLPSLDGFGYREAAGYLSGKLSMAGAVAQYQAATHRYIRRQMTWFGRDKRVRWIESGPDAPSTAAALIRDWLATA